MQLAFLFLRRDEIPSRGTGLLMIQRAPYCLFCLDDPDTI